MLDDYRERMLAGDRARRETLYAAHGTAPRDGAGTGDALPVRRVVPSVAAPVQSDMFGEDLGSGRHRVECEKTGKRGKHFGGAHHAS